MTCCNRRRERATVEGQRPPRVAPVGNTICGPGWTRVQLRRDYGAPRPFYGPATGTCYQFGGRRRVGCVHSDDLESCDPEGLGILQMRDAAGSLFARV
jgi:hypothetical protein